MHKRRGDDRGAAAVEFALVLPLLLVLVLGILEFGRVFNIQIALSNAAREGARYMAVHDDPAAATGAAIAAALIDPEISSGQVSITPSSCDGLEDASVEVTIDYTVELMTGWFGVSLPLEGKGVMICGG
ncbi:pilus assembly protein [Agromyces sp. ISL-38]|nr:pilus assembly protein [Agromyces sp. ISL-38]